MNKKVKLFELADKKFINVAKGKNLPKNYRDKGDFPVIAAGKSIAYFSSHANYNTNTITISSSGANAGFVWKHTYPIWASDCTVIEVNENINLDYFYLFLLSKQEIIYSFQAGAGQPHVYWKDIKNIEIDLPSLEKQRKIAKTLDKANELIELRKESITKLDALAKSIFIDMFGDPVSNPKGWEVKKLKEIIILQRGHDLPTNQRDLDGEIDLYGASGLSGKHNIAKVFGGGIITGRSGTIGQVNYTKKDFWPLNTTLFSKETFNNNLIFLCYLLRFLKLENYANYTSVPTLNRNIIHEIEVYDISINLQNKFAKIIEKIEEQKSLYTQELEKLQNNFDALLQKSFQE